MYVPARERKIAELLVGANQPITIQRLAEELEVSVRTVHRDLKGLEDLLMNHRLKLKKVGGKGVAISGEESDRNTFIQLLYKNDVVDYTPEERSFLMLSWLLEANEPIKLVSMANDLGVSLSTITQDLNRLEDLADKLRLKLIRKRGYGIEVKGKENDIREAIQHLIMQQMDEGNFLKLIRKQMSEGTDLSVDAVSTHLLGLVNKDRIRKIEDVIESVRHDLTYPLADISYIGLVIHLALAIERLELGENIEMDAHHLQTLKQTR